MWCQSFTKVNKGMLYGKHMKPYMKEKCYLDIFFVCQLITNNSCKSSIKKKKRVIHVKIKWNIHVCN